METNRATNMTSARHTWKMTVMVSEMRSLVLMRQSAFVNAGYGLGFRNDGTNGDGEGEVC